MKKINYRLQQSYKQQGIGLLELMLALAIIAILLVMATRYYMSASLNSRIDQTADALNSLPAAGECWIADSNNTLGNYTNLGTNLYRLANTDKCYPLSLVTSSNLLILPYGTVTVTSSAEKICVNTITAGTTAEANMLIQKLCKGQNVTATSNTFSYEAVYQTCAAGGQNQCS